MDIGVIATRLNGTDGVTLEVEKWAHVLTRMGHTRFYYTGELGGCARAGKIIPEMHFGDHQIFVQNQRVFMETSENVDELVEDIQALADQLQPTRVVRRKGIEKALLLIKGLDISRSILLITHGTSDEGESYWRWLSREAEVLGVDLRLINDQMDLERSQREGHKVYSLWDIYLHADMVTFPRDYESFGSALLDAIHSKCLTVINRYPIYNAEIGPLGFELVEMDGIVGQDSAQGVQSLLDNPERLYLIVDKNYAIALKHFEREVLESQLQNRLDPF